MNSETVSLQIVRQHQVCQESSILGEKEEELENGFIRVGVSDVRKQACLLPSLPPTHWPSSTFDWTIKIYRTYIIEGEDSIIIIPCLVYKSNHYNPLPVFPGVAPPTDYPQPVLQEGGGVASASDRGWGHILEILDIAPKMISKSFSTHFLLLNNLTSHSQCGSHTFRIGMTKWRYSASECKKTIR